MAPGYVIAVGLEVAGCLGVAFALVAMRAERRTRSATLSSILRSGGPGIAARRRNVPLRLVGAPVAAEAGEGVQATFVDARTALRRALPTACAA